VARRDGFTLVELSVVVSVAAILLVTAVPNLMNAKKSANEISALGSLKAFTVASQQYRTRFQRYARTLQNLGTTGYVDSLLSAGRRSGYRFTYTVNGQRWSVRAIPLTQGITGDRGFYVDETGVFRVDPAGTATSSSPPVK